MVIRTFQCYSLKSSHPRLLPQSPKDCSIHLCLFCCLAYTVTVHFSSVQFSHSVMSDSLRPHEVQRRQAFLSITNSQSSLKLMSIESVMPSSHLIFCHPLLLLPSIFPSIRVFSNESVICIRWPNYWSFSFQHQSFQ